MSFHTHQNHWVRGAAQSSAMAPVAVPPELTAPLHWAECPPVEELRWGSMEQMMWDSPRLALRQGAWGGTVCPKPSLRTKELLSVLLTAQEGQGSGYQY